MLDLSLLGQRHFVFFTASFLITFIALQIILTSFPKALRTAPGKPHIRLAGFIFASVIALLGFIIISDSALRFSLLAAVILTIFIGRVDEMFDLSSSWQLLGQITIAATMAIGGWTIHYVSNPWAGGVIMIPAASLLTAIWLVFIMNAINWLDGVDGLAPSVGSVAFFTLAAVSLLPSVQDGHTLLLSLIGAGGTLAFLLWNWSPAKVYLGTSGSWFLGLFIGAVAIVGGGKIATTLLVLAIPAIDALLVILQRITSGRAPWHGDTRHLHHWLLKANLSPAVISSLALSFTALLGFLSLTLQTQEKFTALIITSVIMVILILLLNISSPHAKTNN